MFIIFFINAADKRRACGISQRARDTWIGLYARAELKDNMTRDGSELLFECLYVPDATLKHISAGFGYDFSIPDVRSGIYLNIKTLSRFLDKQSV